MSAAKDFDAAIAQALRLSQEHADAFQLVRKLTRELGDAVRAKTSDVVTVDVVPATSLARQDISSAVANAVAQLRPRPREVGGDREDEQVRQLVIATVASGANRVLWEVELADSGYPVTIRGPEDGESVTCFSEGDVRDAFVEAASHGLVGRKIAALVAHEKAKRATPASDGS